MYYSAGFTSLNNCEWETLGLRLSLVNLIRRLGSQPPRHKAHIKCCILIPRGRVWFCIRSVVKCKVNPSKKFTFFLLPPRMAAIGRSLTRENSEPSVAAIHATSKACEITVILRFENHLSVKFWAAHKWWWNNRNQSNLRSGNRGHLLGKTQTSKWVKQVIYSRYFKVYHCPFSLFTSCLKMPHYGLQWTSQASSRLPSADTFRNAPKRLRASNDLCWRNPTHCLPAAEMCPLKWEDKDKCPALSTRRWANLDSKLTTGGV